MAYVEQRSVLLNIFTFNQNLMVHWHETPPRSNDGHKKSCGSDTSLTGPRGEHTFLQKTKLQ